jgi:RNA polymerase sigma-70 factor (ECF subfamily)
MDEPDSSLVARTLGGEPRAFEELAHRHRPGLIRCVKLMIGDADEAESLAQEALTRAYAQLAAFQPDLLFGFWVRGIALNLARNYLRSRVRHGRPIAPSKLGDVPAKEGRSQGVLSGILRKEEAELTEKAISDLPSAFNEVFVLHFVERLDYATISRLTGVPEQTLRVRAHRARTLLRANLGSVVDTWLRDNDVPKASP